jgi:hypothetical protein
MNNAEAFIDLTLDADLVGVLETLAVEQNCSLAEVCEFILQESLKPNSNFWNYAYLKPCPFCGTVPDTANIETMYPNGTAWVQTEDDSTEYVDFDEAPAENWCYSIYCVETSGGCGAVMPGKSKQDAISKWNRSLLKKE